MAQAITEFDRRFEIPDTAQVVEGNGGLPKVRITTPEVAGEMYLHGAHVTSWKPAGGQEVLFLSSQSRWEEGRTHLFPLVRRQDGRSQGASSRLRPHEGLAD
jgi:hypothetical protein